MQTRFLDFMGPFARVMSIVLAAQEIFRDDLIEYGLRYHKPEYHRYHPLGYFNQSFIVWKAAAMKEDWLTNWYESVGETGLVDPMTRLKLEGYENKPAYIKM